MSVRRHHRHGRAPSDGGLLIRSRRECAVDPCRASVRPCKTSEPNKSASRCCGPPAGSTGSTATQCASRARRTTWSEIGTPERGDKARCDDERRRAEAATKRLRALVASGDVRLIRVACPQGKRAREIAIWPFVWIAADRRPRGRQYLDKRRASPPCGATSCPQRRPWCWTAAARRFMPGGFLLRRSVQNHSPGMYWSRTNTERDKNRPTPLNNATVTNESMLATDIADTRGKSHAIAALISFSKIFRGLMALKVCLSRNQRTTFNHHALIFG